MLVKDAKMFTMEQEDFNRVLDNLNEKLEYLKANNLEYYTKVIEGKVNDVNELLKDSSITDSIRIRLKKILKILNR